MVAGRRGDGLSIGFLKSSAGGCTMQPKAWTTHVDNVIILLEGESAECGSRVELAHHQCQGHERKSPLPGPVPGMPFGVKLPASDGSFFVPTSLDHGVPR